MKICPCWKCRAEAFVEADVHGWKVECSVMPAAHNYGPCKSREKAVKGWNDAQRAAASAT